MLRFSFLLLLACCLPDCNLQDGHQTETPGSVTPGPVPFVLTIAEHPIAAMPALHSMALAEHDGKLILLAGRTNGMHGFPGGRSTTAGPSFPVTSANENVYVIDLAAGTLLGSASVKGLGDALWPQLASTNTQYITMDKWMILAGGYGVTADASTFVTFGRITAIDMDALIATVTGGGVLDAAFAQQNIASVEATFAAITGGSLEQIGDNYGLVLGHQYDGQYTVGGGGVNQVYSNAIRMFSMTVDDSAATPVLTATMIGINPSDALNQPPDSTYHRRDLTVAPAIMPGGQAVIGVYGGVFKGGNFEGYVTPMYASSDPSCPAVVNFVEDTTATQWLSQYHCALIQAYATGTSSMYSTFFGGISQYYWDAATSSLKRDPIDLANGIDGLPFIDSISTLKRDGTGTQQYLLQGLTFPPAASAPVCGSEPAKFLGGETDFILADGIPTLAGGVIDLDKITSPTMIGYLVGGMASTKPYPGNATCASNKVYKVTLDPTRSADTVTLTLP